MALIYYPQSSYITERNTASGSMVVLSIDVMPNNIFFFDTASELAAISSSVADSISASYAATASHVIASIASASYITGSINGNVYTLGGDYWREHTNTSSYSLTAADNGKILVFTTGSTIIVTGSLPLGFNCSIYQSGSSTLIVSSSDGTSRVRNRSGHSGSAGQYAMLSLIRFGITPEFVLAGDTA